MKTYLIFAISLLSTSFTFSQTVVIDGVPRDTSFALNTTYQKELRYRPYIEPVRASLPDNVLANEGVTYKTVENAWGKHELKMNIYRPNDGKELSGFNDDSRWRMELRKFGITSTNGTTNCN